MLKRFLLAFLVTGSILSNGHAQNRCVTDEVYNKLKSEHPEIALYEGQLEQSIKSVFESAALNRIIAKTTGGPMDTVYYDVPIVVHIIHDYGTENISDDNMINAVNYWITVFAGQNYSDSSNVIAPFRKYIGNPGMHLHLATIDPNGKPTKGIVRHQSYLTFNGGDQAKLDPWPQDKYINIWFVNVFGSAYTGAAAYAYLPASAATLTYYDGVICLASYYNTDKTIPHEIGHVFNLQHTWGNTNQPDVACGDDQVDDTPPTKGHNPSSCGNAAAIFDATCATGYLKHYTLPGGADSVEDYPDTANSQNIMDYTYCELMFTKGQAARMRATIASNTAGRNNLYSPANLAATGALAGPQDLPPVADFSIEKGIGSTSLTSERSFFQCANSPDYSFQFKNQSWNDTISSVQWILSNGATTAASSSTTQLVTRFSKPGWATVTLIASSNAGSDTVARQAVYVADPNATLPEGYLQNFASLSDHDNWPAFNYYNNNFKWEWFSSGGYDDAGCMRYRSFDYRTSPENKSGTPVGDYDDMFTPGFDLTTVNPGGTVNLNFFTSGSSKSGGGTPDSLEIWGSTTCGGKWIKITAFGSALANVSAQTTEFIPGSSQWKAQTVAVPVALISNATFFKFRYKPGNRGNNLYFDKFGISGYTTEVKEVQYAPGIFNVYPNPSNGDCNLVFVANGTGKVNYDIKDITGKVVYHKEAVYPQNVTVQEHIAASVLPSAGMYFMTLSNNNIVLTKKLVIIR